MSGERRQSTGSRALGGLDVQIPEYDGDAATEGLVLKYGDEVRGCV